MEEPKRKLGEVPLRDLTLMELKPAFNYYDDKVDKLVNAVIDIKKTLKTIFWYIIIIIPVLTIVISKH